MGIFSEIHAEMEAKGLQKPLLAAIESENKDIIEFCKKYIYPLYSYAAGDSFSTELYNSKEFKLIEKVFGKNK